MEYGLIGMPLGHSFSQEIHESLGWYRYELHPVEAADFPAFMEARAFRGINVTIPYKQDVIPYLDEIDPLAAEIGAVNCIVNRNGKLCGYNTDLAGMQALVEKLGLDLRGKKVLICGTGGTSKTARTMARAAGALDVIRLSRTVKMGADFADVITYAQAYIDHTDAQIIVNTTPSGMFPNNGEWAINAAAFPQLEGIIDAIYNPLETALVQQGRALGVPSAGGLYMLVAQAVIAAERFMGSKGAAEAAAANGNGASAELGSSAAATDNNGADAARPAAAGEASGTKLTSSTSTGAEAVAFPTTKVQLMALCDRIFAQLERKKRNIVLIGMPACGKTTVGTLLAEKTSRTFIDTDQVIREISGKTPGQIINEAGEDVFRAIEAQAIAQAGKNTGCIISTGGGAILRLENVAALRQNGTLYFIDRPVDQLIPTNDRPLSNSAEKLVQLYDERYPAYAACADFTIPVNGSAASVAQCIEERHFS